MISYLAAGLKFYQQRSSKKLKPQLKARKNYYFRGGEKKEIMTSKYYGSKVLLEINLTSAMTMMLQGQKRSDTPRISIL